MKRITPLAAALVAAGAAAEPLPLEHVLVSVPIHKKSAETALPVTVLTGDELRRAASATIGDTLSYKPGLANASFGPAVGQPVIRGQQGARVTVLQNGTSSADASNLSADHAVAAEPMLAESVEVLRGPSTLLYGGGAIGGVVNIIDNRIPANRQEGVSGGAEYRHDSAADMDTLVFRLDGGSGAFAYHLSGLYRDWNDVEIPGRSVRETDHEDEEQHEDEEHDEEPAGARGYIPNSGGDTGTLNVGGSYHFDSGFVGLAVNRLENEYGIPSGAHSHGGHEEEHEEEEHEEEEHEEGEHDEEGDVSIDMEQTRWDAALHLHEPFAGADVFRGFLTYTDYEHAELEGSGEVGTEYSNETWETRLELLHREFGGFPGVIGLQALSGDFSALGEESFIPETDSTELGLFLVEDYHAGDWIFELGARFDRDERDPDTASAGKETFSSFSASGSALWQVTEEWGLGAALSRSERAPTIEELYSNVEAESPDELVVHAATNAIEVGDSDLDTEVSNNLDLSLNWQRGLHFAEITVFYNDFSDYINLFNTGVEVEEVPVLTYTQDDAEFWGVEVDSEFALGSAGGGEFRLGLFGDYIRGELDDGDDIPRLPPSRLGLRFLWTADNFDVWTRVIEADDQDRPGSNEESTEGYTRWDLGGEYRFPAGAGELLLFAEFSNITDEEIRLSTSFLRDVAPEPGRSVGVGLRYVF
jgi:iron complex outermembrane receptor protein